MPCFSPNVSKLVFRRELPPDPDDRPEAPAPDTGLAEFLFRFHIVETGQNLRHREVGASHKSAANYGWNLSFGETVPFLPGYDAILPRQYCIFPSKV